jgi:hypothetical protein
MTIQSPDVLNINNSAYQIVSDAGVGLFHPRSMGIATAVCGTDLHRGFRCRYGIVDGSLILHEVMICFAGTGEYPVIGGKNPVRRGGYLSYDTLSLFVPFDGGLVVCADPVLDPVGTSGIIVVWSFRTVIECEFRGGLLLSKWDHSSAVRELREHGNASVFDARTRSLVRQIYRTTELRQARALSMEVTEALELMRGKKDDT